MRHVSLSKQKHTKTKTESTKQNRKEKTKDERQKEGRRGKGAVLAFYGLTISSFSVCTIKKGNKRKCRSKTEQEEEAIDGSLSMLTTANIQ